MSVTRGPKKVIRRTAVQGKTKPTALGFFVMVILAILPAFFQGKDDENTPNRAPASASRSPASNVVSLKEKVVITPVNPQETNLEKKITKYALRIDFEIALNSKLTYADILHSYRTTDESNSVSTLLAEHKDKKNPLRKVRTKSERIEAADGKYYFELTGWADGWKVFYKSHSRTLCSERMNSSGNVWIQTCDLDPTTPDATKYMDLYHQVTTCANKGTTVLCSNEFSGLTKNVHVPGVIRAFIGFESYSGNQSAYLVAQNLTDSIYAFATLFGYAAPLKDHVKEAMSEYFSKGLTGGTLLERLEAAKPQGNYPDGISKDDKNREDERVLNLVSSFSYSTF